MCNQCGILYRASPRAWKYNYMCVCVCAVNVGAYCVYGVGRQPADSMATLALPQLDADFYFILDAILLLFLSVKRGREQRHQCGERCRKCMKGHD